MIDRALTILTVVVWALVGALAVVLVLTYLEGCGTIGPVKPDPIVDKDLDACDAACDRLRELGCPAGDGSPGRDEVMGNADDTPCEQVCRDVVGAYSGSTLHQKCTAKAESCEAVEECFDREAR